MPMIYKTFAWRYKSRNPKVSFIVFARTREVADEIIAIENRENVYFLKPARFLFKRACTVDVPPYELEQSQIRAAVRCLKRRRQYFAEHPEERPHSCRIGEA